MFGFRSKQQVGSPTRSSIPWGFVACGVLLGSVAAKAEIPTADSSHLAKPGDVVILLHGLGRTAGMWSSMEEHLTESGLRPLALDYPSRKRPLEWLADSLLDPVLDSLEDVGVRRVHFVTQSMGAILLRSTLARHGHRNLGVAVMIAPPNQGSEVATVASRFGYGDWILGPNLKRLSKTNRGFFDSLGPAPIPTGVIAGDRTWNFLNSLAIPGPDDGKVSVQSTHLPGQADWTLVHENHTFLHSCQASKERTLRFLTQGRFLAEEAPLATRQAAPRKSGAALPGASRSEDRTRRR